MKVLVKIGVDGHHLLSPFTELATRLIVLAKVVPWMLAALENSAKLRKVLSNSSGTEIWFLCEKTKAIRMVEITKLQAQITSSRLITDFYS